MAKIVRYNGNTLSHFYCSDPKKLTREKEYEVISKVYHGPQKNYVLKGVEGEFDSAWFDEIEIDKPIFIAVANSAPSIGKVFKCFKIEPSEGKIHSIECYTRNIKEVLYLGSNTYRVITEDSVYYVQIV